MEECRWTVRGVDRDAIKLLKQVAQDSEIPIGEILSDAIYYWYEDLPEE